MGSRACAANHYVIVEKCGYPEMYVHIFGERRFSEQLPIWGSLWLSENCRNAPGIRNDIVENSDMHNFHDYYKRASRRHYKGNFHI